MQNVMSLIADETFQGMNHKSGVVWRKALFDIPMVDHVYAHATGTHQQKTSVPKLFFLINIFPCLFSFHLPIEISRLGGKVGSIQ